MLLLVLFVIYIGLTLIGESSDRYIHTMLEEFLTKNTSDTEEFGWST